MFDQYSQVENKVTHALFCALNADSKLLRSFLIDIAKCEPPEQKQLTLSVQKLPGQNVITEAEFEKAGIPDAWITTENGWCLMVENKVQSDVSVSQLSSHFSTALRRGYDKPKLLVLTIKKPNQAIPRDATIVEWKDVYRWLDDRTKGSEWAERAKDYLEITEAREVEREALREGTLTAFNGFDFGEQGYSYLQAKRLLKLAIDELKNRPRLMESLGIEPALPGRGAITGTGTSYVWDCLRPSGETRDSNFTDSYHFTLGIENDQVSAMVTVPDKLRASARRKLRDLGSERFRELTEEIAQNMEPILQKYPGAIPRARVVQRRYKSQRSVPEIDAELSFDLRTTFEGSGPKMQTQWSEALFNSFSHRNSNIQFQIGALFPYGKCQAISEANAIDCIAEAWEACLPLVHRMRD